jgi:hypothetical protein
MLSQKDVVPLPRQRYEKELQQLYARRVAIEGLIQSLQEYDRIRSKRLKVEQRRSA